MKRATVRVIREYGPFPDVPRVNGVTFDGAHVWIAVGESLKAIDPASGRLVRTLAVPANAGTAFDGRYLYQVDGERIQKIDPATGSVVATVPAPDGGASGMAWAEGSLWVGQFRSRRIHEIDPRTGAILRTIESNRFVTGVTWAEGHLWHATAEAGASELRRIDPSTGDLREEIEMPANVIVSGLDFDGAGHFLCGGASSGTVRVIDRVTPE